MAYDTEWINLTFKVEQLYGTEGLSRLVEIPSLQFTEKEKNSVISSTQLFQTSPRNQPGAGVLCDLLLEKFKKMSDRNVRAMIRDPYFSVPLGLTSGLMAGLLFWEFRWNFLFVGFASGLMQFFAYEIGKMKQGSRYLERVSEDLKKQCQELLSNPPQCSVCGSPAVRKCSICESLNPHSKAFLCGPKCGDIHGWTVCGKQTETSNIAEA